MSDKKKFFKEEVSTYTDLFSKHSVKKKDGQRVPLEVAAKLLEENTLLPWHDQVLLLLKGHG